MSGMRSAFSLDRHRKSQRTRAHDSVRWCRPPSIRNRGGKLLRLHVYLGRARLEVGGAQQHARSTETERSFNIGTSHSWALAASIGGIGDHENSR